MSRRPQHPSEESSLARPALLSSFQPVSEHAVIVRYPEHDFSKYSSYFEASAQRLAFSFQGEPADDAFLLPFLFLYRQAIELQLKSHVQLFATIRARCFPADAANLLSTSRPDYLRKRFGHNLRELLEITREHYEFLVGRDTFPLTVSQFVMRFHEDDPSGVSFRYPGILPNVQETSDFPSLANYLAFGYASLFSIRDHVEDSYAEVEHLTDVD